MATDIGNVEAPVYLDADDPFEKVLIPIIRTNRKKRGDYAVDGSPFTNFESTSQFANFENRWLSALFNCQQKLARIQALRANGRLDDPNNEAVLDTLLDNAVYGVIALAIATEDIECLEALKSESVMAATAAMPEVRYR